MTHTICITKELPGKTDSKEILLEKYGKQLESSLLGNFDATLQVFKLIFYTKDNMAILQEFSNFFKPFAEAGNGYGQNIYGWCIEKMGDCSEALKWYIASSEQYNEYGMESLANFYFNGICVEQNYEKSYELSLKSSEKGNHFASAALGYFYYHGDVVEENYEKAFSIFLEAAKHGIFIIYDSLGYLYLEGKGTEKDTKMAEYFFNKALESNDLDGAISLAKMYKDGNGVEPNSMTALEYCLNYDYSEEEQLKVVNGIIKDIITNSDNPMLLLREYHHKK